MSGPSYSLPGRGQFEKVRRQAQREGIDPGSTAAALAACIILAVGLSALAATAPLPSVGFILGGGIGLLGILALAILRYDLAVGLGIMLLSIVKIEPAPPDLVFAVVIGVATVTGRMNMRRVPPAAAVAVISFLGLNVISAIDAVSLSEATFYFTITLYLIVFALWFADWIKDEKRARIVVCAYLFVATVFGALGTGAFLLHFPGWQFFVENEDARAAGLFKDPNVYGPFLIPIALITIEEILQPRLLRLSLPVKLLCVLCMSGGVIFSFSRAAWLSLMLGMAIMIGIYAVRRGGGRKAILMSLIIAVGALSSATALIASGSLDFLEQRTTLQSYDTDRFASQRNGLESAERNPLGVGPGQFDKISPIAAHSTYVRVLAEQGILGGLAIGVFLFATLGYAIKNALLGRSTYGIGSAPLLGAWAGLMLNSVVVDTLHWRHLWFIAALVWAGTMRRPSSALASPGHSAPQR